MQWMNLEGVIFMIIMMIPNLIFALKCKDGFQNKWNHPVIEFLEQIGRFGCFGFMMINVPGTYFGWLFYQAKSVYFIMNSILLFFYCLFWYVFFYQNSIFKSLVLSIIPSMIFLLSGILMQSVLLIVFALVFAPCHILISYKNAKCIIEVKR